MYDGELVTPTLESGALAGVTRALVLEWFGATERDVQAIHRVDDRDLPAPGPITAQVTKIFADRSADEPNP